MAHPGFAGLDTPRANAGDATYLSRAPDFDLSQEPSFVSPVKNDNIFQQLRNGGKPSLRTPRAGGSRAPFAERRNLPAGIGGAEFTPLLKSATRNSSRRYGGKENGRATPGLDRGDDDSTRIPAVDISSYRASRHGSSYVESTPLPQVDSSSIASTPLVMKPRGGETKGPLRDGNQLSLREQEQVIDRIEKENFGLKLKIHFLEEALRKAGPGYSEAALKENTDLKVDKVTMSRELQRYKKHLTSAEKELEDYRQQILEVQEKAKRKYANEDQRVEIERLRRELEKKDADIEDLQRQLDSQQKTRDNVEKLQDEIGDLEADGREKDRIIGEHEDEIEDLKTKLDSAEDRMKDAQRRMIELEEKAQSSERLQEAKETIADLEADVRRLEQQVDDVKEKLDDAVSQKEQAEANLEELQEEMANKSIHTKGLSRQVEEKVARLQSEIDRSRQECAQLEQQHDARLKEADDLKLKLKESRQARDSAEHEARSLAAKLENAQAELNTIGDQKALLQGRHDSLAKEADSLHRDVTRLTKAVSQLEADLEQERQHGLSIEREMRNQFKDQIDRLNDEISDLQAEVREKERLYDGDSEKWETERHNLESDRARAEERAAGLQRTIDKLRQAEGALSDKETRLQEAIISETERHRSEEAVLSRQIEDLQRNLDARQASLEDLRRELSAVKDDLRQTQLDYEAQKEKAEGLEDEVEVLQTALDEESEKAQREQEAVRKECENLKEQLASLREAAKNARVSTAATQSSAEKHYDEQIELLKTQLGESSARLVKVTKEKQGLQDQLANINIELHTLRSSLAETKAERDEIEAQLRRAKQQEEDTFRLDQERIDLRTAKMKLDNEVRRLRDENKSLTEQCHAIEKTLEEEIEKAATEEERLGQEVRDLQARIRQSNTENQDIHAARRTIRELERRIEDYETQLAATTIALPANSSGDDASAELAIIRRDLAAARSKEREYLQREASQKEMIKSLKREIVELERALHEAELATTALPANTSTGEGSSEISALRRDLSAARTKEREHLQREAQLEAAHKDTVKSLRRQITELERALHEAELATTALPAAATAGEGSSEASILRRDLSAARAKEIDFLQREASHKDTVKNLRRQIAELERAAHNAEMSRLMAGSPAPSDVGSARKSEIAELRQQLAATQQSVHDLKKSLREAERRSSSAARDLQARLDEAEEEKQALEQALDDAQVAAHESAEAHQVAVQKYRTKLERYKQERDELAEALAEVHNRTQETSSDVSREERKDLHAMLRKTQIEADALERELREQKDALEAAARAEETLRAKLDRARGERAAYRADAERLQREIESLREARTELVALHDETTGAVVPHRRSGAVMSGANGDGDAAEAGALVQTSEEQQARRHRRELRGLTLQIEWMQARWERESKLRQDAAFAKRYLLFELEMRVACNKADLHILRSILQQLGIKDHPVLQQRQEEEQRGKRLPGGTGAKKPFNLGRFATVVRFVVRLRIAARAWAHHEQSRLRLTASVEAAHKAERMRRMRDEWRAQMAAKRVKSVAAA